METDITARYDVIVIGGGPAGLNAALLLGRSRRKVIVIDAGQPRNAAAGHLHGFLGHDGIEPLELLRRGREEVARYGVEVCDDLVTSTENISVEPSALQFQVTTRSGRSLRARRLLIATGTRDTLPDFEGVRECYGRSLHHCPYCDGWEHRGQRLVAYSDQAQKAVALALLLKGWSNQVTALTNGAEIPAAELNQLALNGIAWRQEPIERLRHEGTQLISVELAGPEPIAADAMFFSLGQKGNCELAESLGCDVNENSLAEVGRRQHTNVPGVFLAGDADGDVQFAIVAAAEGAKAAVTIDRELRAEDTV